MFETIGVARGLDGSGLLEVFNFLFGELSIIDRFVDLKFIFRDMNKLRFATQLTTTPVLYKKSGPDFGFAVVDQFYRKNVEFYPEFFGNFSEFTLILP